MRNRQRNRRRQRRRRAELRRLSGQLRGWSCRWWRRRRERRVSCGRTAERLHLDGPQTLLPQPLLVAALQPALQEAAEAAEHDDDGPDQPEAGETGQEGVGALWHHHGSEGTGWEVPPRGGKGRFQTGSCCGRDSSLQDRWEKIWHVLSHSVMKIWIIKVLTRLFEGCNPRWELKKSRVTRTLVSLNH